MVTTVTLNPCIDRTIVTDGFHYGGHNRVQNMREDAAGKGINVSIALKGLGGETQAVWFKRRKDGNLLSDRLDGAGVPHWFIEVDGAVRVNLKLFNAKEKVMTEINDGGSEVSAENVKAVTELILQTLQNGAENQILVLSGSVPKGVPPDFYETIGKSVPESVKVILDADDALFRQGLNANPHVVKPNLFELENWIGRKLETSNQMVAAAKKLLSQGAQAVALSLGGDGAFLIGREESYFSSGAEIPIKGLQGAGDSMVAGICLAMEKRLPLAEWLRYGMAAAHASIMREGTLLCRAEDFSPLLSKIQVMRL